jgi:glutamate--cysteine ligase
MAVINAFAQDAVDRAEPLTVAAAYAQCRDAALAESAIGAIGLEIEPHLVDLDHVADPGPWKRVEAITAAVGRAAPGTAVTAEPGRPIELSGPPEAGVGPAVDRLRYQGAGARLALADRRLGLAYAGADPARPSRRVNPRPRYRAMEQHFAATGRTAAGQVMMNSTAALQVNLQVGPRGEWPARVARAYRLGPTLVAIAASSPWLHGRDTGWKSVRQRAWSGLDARTCGPVPGCAAKDGPCHGRRGWQMVDGGGVQADQPDTGRIQFAAPGGICQGMGAAADRSTRLRGAVLGNGSAKPLHAASRA